MDVWTKFEEGGSRCSRVINRKRLGTFNPGDLDLWPSDFKMNILSLLPRMDVLTKFEEGGSRCSRVINRKRLGTFNPGDLDLWPSDFKMNIFPLLPRMDVLTKFEEGRSRLCDMCKAISPLFFKYSILKNMQKINKLQLFVPGLWRDLQRCHQI